MAGAAAAALSPCPARVYAPRFLPIKSCTIARVCYYIPMNENETLDDYDWDWDQYEDCVIDLCWEDE
jgi:hypothetical protein